MSFILLILRALGCNICHSIFKIKQMHPMKLFLNLQKPQSNPMFVSYRNAVEAVQRTLNNDRISIDRRLEQAKALFISYVSKSRQLINLRNDNPFWELIVEMAENENHLMTVIQCFGCAEDRESMRPQSFFRSSQFDINQPLMYMQNTRTP